MLLVYRKRSAIFSQQKKPKGISIVVQESILPNFDFFVFPIIAFKLGHFKVLTIFSHDTNTQA
jgi:hypothetical protein